METLHTIAELRRALEPRGAARRSASSRRWARSTRAIWRCSRPPAPSATSSSRASSSTRRSSRTRADLAPTRATSRPTSARRRRRGRPPLRPGGGGVLPARLRDLGRARRVRRSGSRASSAPGHFRGVATACLKLFTIVRPDVAYFGRKDAQQVAVDQAGRPRPRTSTLEIRVVETVRDADGLALSSRNVRLSRGGAGARRARFPARSRPATPTVPARCSPRPASSPTTSRSPTSTGRPSPSPPGSARPA